MGMYGSEEIYRVTRCDSEGGAVILSKVPDHPNVSRSKMSEPNPIVTSGVSLRSLRAEAEILAIGKALEQTGWNRKRAAELLSISYRGLLYKMRQHNIAPPKYSELTPVA